MWEFIDASHERLDSQWWQFVPENLLFTTRDGNLIADIHD